MFILKVVGLHQKDTMYPKLFYCLLDANTTIKYYNIIYNVAVYINLYKLSHSHTQNFVS